MKKILTILCILLACILLASCSSKLDRAKQVKEGMTYDEVKELMGEDGVDIGSGMVIYRWDLEDGQILVVWMSIDYSEDDVTLYVSSCEIDAKENHPAPWEDRK